MDKNHNGIGDVADKRIATLTDIDGDLITVTLKGAGTFALAVDDPDGDHKGEVRGITLFNTNQTSTLSIITKKAGAGNGQANVSTIMGTGLKSISAATANITQAVSLSSYVGSLTVRDVASGASIMTNGTATQTTTITAHVIGDGAKLELSNLTNLSAARIGEAEITAPGLGTVSIKGDAKAHIAGDLGATVTLSGEGFAAGKATLGSLTVAGTLREASVRSAGSIGAVTLGAITDSLIFAGVANDVTGLPAELQNPLASIASLTVKGTSSAASFTRSLVAAGVLTNVKLKVVAPSNGGQVFGFAADKIKAYSRTGLKPSLKNLDTANGNNDPTLGGDFVLRTI